MSAVDARFAGGTVFVEPDREYIGDGRAVVRLALPGHTVPLFPHEARALAQALNAAADAAQPTRPLKRPHSATEAHLEREG